MDIQRAIAKLVSGQHLGAAEMEAVMTTIMQGEAQEAQIGGLLVALRMLGENADEIAGAAAVMRRLATPIHINLENTVDIVGTGGDGANLFNVSTASSFVIAAAGGRVAKHGNRSVSSSSGAADVLEAAGVNLSLDSEQVARCVDELGVGFIFAPTYHSAMRHAIGPRKALGMRTIFNLLGPLTNPAGVRRQVIGVYDKAYCRLLAEVLQRFGSEHAMVVHSEDGLDEISLAAPTHVVELKDGTLNEYTITPEALGIESAALAGLEVDTAEESLALIQDALGKQRGPNAGRAADMIGLNAGAAIYVCGIADSLQQGVVMAQDAIASGLGGEKIRELAAFTECFSVCE